MELNPFETLPKDVVIDGERYEINSDFRVGISIELEALSENGADVKGLLSAFYPQEIPRDINVAVDKMIEFYRGYEHTMKEKKEKKANSRARWYDFRQDADVLFASFFDSYGIDLTAANMHWWTFRFLMFNLPSDSAFMERIHYRTANINKVDKKLQPHYRKMKKLYALKNTKAKESISVEERDAAMKEKVRKLFEEAQNATERKAP